MTALQRLILACLLASIGPQTVAEIAMCVGATETDVSPQVDALMSAGHVGPDGAGIEITATGEALIRESIGVTDVPTDEGEQVNLAFAEAPVAGDTFLTAERDAHGLTPGDVRALGAVYLEVALRAAIKNSNPLLIQRAARRAGFAFRGAAGVAALDGHLASRI